MRESNPGPPDLTGDPLVYLDVELGLESLHERVGHQMVAHSAPRFNEEDRRIVFPKCRGVQVDALLRVVVFRFFVVIVTSDFVRIDFSFFRVLIGLSFLS